MKRFIAILMTLCLMLGVSSVSAWAAEEATWQKEVAMPVNALGSAISCVVGNDIYILGACGNGSIGIYNTKTKTLENGPQIPLTNVTISKLVCIGNKIYAFSLDAMQVYDLVTKEWSTIKNEHTFELGTAVVAIGEKMYAECKGGIAVYDTVSNKWTYSKAKSPTLEGILSYACAYEKKVYCVGGSVGVGANATDKLAIYDTETDTWETGKSMPEARTGLGVTMVGSKLYAIGGQKYAHKDSVYIYDTKTDSWSVGPSLPNTRTDFSAQMVNGKIYIIGGQSCNTIDSLQVGTLSDDSALKLSVLLNEDENIQLSTSYNLDNNKDFTWSSTNEAVAKVDANGKVTAISEGTADIYAQKAEGTFKEYIPVKVVKGIADELRLAAHLKIGEKAKLYLTDDASKVTWTCMDDSIVTVTADGQVTGVKKGLAIVKAELDGQAYQIYVRVNG